MFTCIIFVASVCFSWPPPRTRGGRVSVGGEPTNKEEMPRHAPVVTFRKKWRVRSEKEINIALDSIGNKFEILEQWTELLHKGECLMVSFHSVFS